MKKDKEKLVVKYLPLVKYVVDRLSVSSLPQVSQEDLISSGVIGLLKALESFDPSRGVKFKTYALTRIKGAIMDELRRLDWIPRSLRQKATLLEKTYLSLERKLGRFPTDEELLKELNISEKELLQLYSVNHLSCISLEGASQDDNISLKEKVVYTSEENLIEILEKKETKKILKDALEKLPEREKKIIILYYYEGLTLKEIGKVLGISESRVSQIHGKVMLKLKTALSHIKDALAI